MPYSTEISADSQATICKDQPGLSPSQTSDALSPKAEIPSTNSSSKSGIYAWIGNDTAGALAPVHPERESFLDFLCLMFPEGKGVQSVCSLIGYESGWSETRPKERGYTKGIANRQVTVMHGATFDNPKIYVLVPGGACRQLERDGIVEPSPDGWRDYLLRLTDSGGTPTRLDVAVDDYTGTLTHDRIKKHMANGWYATRAKKAPYTQTHPSDIREGWTQAFGGEKADRYLRIYDKTAQLKGVKGINDPRQRERVELLLRGDYARAAVADIIENGFSVIPAHIRAFVDFKTPGRGGTQVSERKAAAWWLEVMAGAAKASYPKPTKMPPSVESAYRHMDRQGPKSLGRILLSLGEEGFIRYAIQKAEEGVARLTPAEREEAAGYLDPQKNVLSEGLLTSLFGDAEELPLAA